MVSKMVSDKNTTCAVFPDPHPMPPSSITGSQSRKSLCPNISITCWNCRGLPNAIPYLEHLSKTDDIIVLAEHWLWPFELSKLDSIVPGFQGTGVSDARLNEQSTLKKGCGGVGIIWKSCMSIDVVSTNSDRIIAVQVPISDCQCLSVIGVYLPTSDVPITQYKEVLNELENVVSALQRKGPVVVVGDFNAHIGELYSKRALGTTNAQGHLLLDMVIRSNQYIASLTNTATGPKHTFSNGDCRTTIDYCLVDSWAAHLVTSCNVLDQHALNLSDHLAIRIKLDCHPQLLVHPKENQPKLNWRKSQNKSIPHSHFHRR